MLNIKSKLPNVGETIFGEMNAVAKKYNAINMGQGFPDFGTDRALLAAVNQAMVDGYNTYAPMPGMPELLDFITEKVQAQHNRSYAVDSEITVTSGATEALMISIQALVHAGDEVILIDPAYDLYAPVIEMQGAIAVRAPMIAPTPYHRSFQLDWNAINSAVTERTRMIILNFPHNPTGIVLQESDLDALEFIINRQPMVILSDEAYEHIIFDNKKLYSPVQREALAPYTVLVSSFAKTLNVTGWKIGYCCAAKNLMREIRKVHQYTVFSVSTPVQIGIANYLKHSSAISELSGFYQQKRDRLFNGLQNTPLQPLPSQGTFFMLADASFMGNSFEKKLALKMAREKLITAIPVSAFYANPNDPQSNHNLLRLCFAKEDATIDRVIEILDQ